MLFRERQQIVICVLAGVMIGGFLLFRYLPLRKRINAIEQTRVSRKAAADKALYQGGQLPALRRQLQKLKQLVGNYEAKVPSDNSLGVFLKRIANLMNEHDLREQRIEPGREVQEVEGLSCVPVTMQCKGRLKHIFEFFSSLQSLERLVRIERVRLQNDNRFTGEVSMQAETVIYYRPEAG